jgi:hypothetical protein
MRGSLGRFLGEIRVLFSTRFKEMRGAMRIE